MEIQIKKTIKAGNSSAVVLPRAWLNKEVRVELVHKTSEMIFSDVSTILAKYTDLSAIIGIYLTGSYARNEEDERSDIDILVITDEFDRELIREGMYSILLVSTKLLKWKLEKDLFPLGQMIREAKPLLNSAYLNSIQIKATKKNVKWYIDTTEEKLQIIKEVIAIARKRNRKILSDKVAYTLVLRIRTMYILNRLLKNENYMKKDFIMLLKKISGGTHAYERYLSVKNNGGDEEGITLEETENLFIYLQNMLNAIKKII